MRTWAIASIIFLSLILLTAVPSTSVASDKKYVHSFEKPGIELRAEYDKGQSSCSSCPTIYRARDAAGNTLLELSSHDFRSSQFQSTQQKLFWVSRTGGGRKTGRFPPDELVERSPSERKRIDEHLFVQDVKTLKREKLLSARVLNPSDTTIEFLASPDATKVAYIKYGSLYMLDMEKKISKMVTEVIEDPELIGWSSDSTKLWLGERKSRWKRTALWQHGKISWLLAPGRANWDSVESIHQADHGWLIESTYMIETCIHDYSSEHKQSADLSLLDLRTGMTIPIAKGSTSKFSPAWTNDDSLTYTYEGTRRTLSAKELRSRIAKLTHKTECKPNESGSAEQELSKLSNWEQIYNHFQKYSHCDSGILFEKHTKIIGDEILESWTKLDKLQSFLSKNEKFEAFVLEHVEQMNSDEHARNLRERATENCPSGFDQLCTKMRRAIDR